MGKYIVQRVLINIPVILVITILVYLMIDLAPGDPVSAMLSPEQRALRGEDWVREEQERLGLNRPLPVRYALWLSEVLRGNLGYSYMTKEPVVQLLGRLLGPTLKLTVTSLIIATVLSLVVGVVSALKQYSIIDHLLTFLSFIGVSLPSFFLSLILIYVFALKLHLLPTGGLRTGVQGGDLVDDLRHLILPVIAMTTPYVAGLARYVRSSTLDVLRMDYVTVARAKGLDERTVIGRHVLRNGLLPFVTITGMRIPSLIAGAVVIEQVFFWPGLGLHHDAGRRRTGLPRHHGNELVDRDNCAVLEFVHGSNLRID